MHKRIVCLISACVFVMSSMSNSITTLATFTYRNFMLKSILEESWFDEEGKVAYPIDYKDEIWDELDTEARYEVCRIPDNVLSELSTNDLLKLVEEYPLFNMLLCTQMTLRNRSNFTVKKWMH